MFQTLTVRSIEAVMTEFQLPTVNGWISIIRAKWASRHFTSWAVSTDQIYNSFLIPKKKKKILKTLKPKKSASNLRKKLSSFLVFDVNFLENLVLKNWQLGLKVFVPTSKCKLHLCMWNGSKVLIYLYFLLCCRFYNSKNIHLKF